MMLHQEYCPHCNVKNIYFDDSLKVNEQVHQDVTNLLDQYQADLKMKNRSKKKKAAEQD